LPSSVQSPSSSPPPPGPLSLERPSSSSPFRLRGLFSHGCALGGLRARRHPSPRCRCRCPGCTPGSLDTPAMRSFLRRVLQMGEAASSFDEGRGESRPTQAAAAAAIPRRPAPARPPARATTPPCAGSWITCCRCARRTRGAPDRLRGPPPALSACRSARRAASTTSPWRRSRRWRDAARGPSASP